MLHAHAEPEGPPVRSIAMPLAKGDPDDPEDVLAQSWRMYYRRADPDTVIHPATLGLDGCTFMQASLFNAPGWEGYEQSGGYSNAEPQRDQGPGRI